MLSEWIELVRPLLTALLLPPVPFLALLCAGAWLALRKKPWRKSAALLFAVSIVGLWASSTQAVGEWLERRWVGDLKPLSAEQLKEFKGQSDVVILVLGGGRLPEQPETGLADVSPEAMQRVRYGVWLRRQTGLPLAFSGGIAASGLSVSKKTEAEITDEIMQREHGLRLAWREDRSRYTRESARMVLPMLRSSGVKRVLLVTHAYHMPRSVRAFEAELAPFGVQVIAAPTAFALARDSLWVSAFPSNPGQRDVRAVWREMLGYAMGR